jgi:hypothetical protein
MEASVNPRAQRLKKFIDDTGMSAREFAKQCNLKSTTSIQAVIKHNRQPSDLLLKQIIQRFPQLSYDWVILGIGEMYTPGAANESSTSAEISKQATFSDIQSKLEMHDYSLNELNNVIKDSMNNLDKKMDLNVEIIASVNLKIDTAINNMNTRVNTFIANQEEQNLQAIKDFQKMMDIIIKSQKAADARANESLKAGMALVGSIEQTKIEGVAMMKAVHDQSNKALELGERALKENKLALKSFGRGLEGYAKDRDKKAKEITLVNVQELYELLKQKGLGTYTKIKKS